MGVHCPSAAQIVGEADNHADVELRRLALVELRVRVWDAFDETQIVASCDGMDRGEMLAKIVELSRTDHESRYVMKWQGQELRRKDAAKGTLENNIAEPKVVIESWTRDIYNAWRLQAGSPGRDGVHWCGSVGEQVGSACDQTIRL